MSKAAELAKWGEVSTNGQVSGRRNIIINGAMNVAQRSTSVTGVGGAGYYTHDRWKIEMGSTAGRLTMSQTADGPNGVSANCLKLDCTTADTSIAAEEYLILTQVFEGQDLQGIGKGVSGAKQVTLSFYVKANAAFTFIAEFQDQDNVRLNGNTFATTTDWVRHEITFEADADDGSSPFDDDNAASARINFWLHAGSNYSSGTLASGWENRTDVNRSAGIDSFFSSTDNTFFITGVQMEVGSVATPFEHRSFGEELALCQRYYSEYTCAEQEWIYFEGNATNHKWWQIPIHATPRATPSVAFIGTFTGSASGGTISAVATSSIKIDRVSFRVTFSGALGDAYSVRHTDTFTSDKISLTSEL